jgi:outer membrane protein OmpA-like peptidoglycan-associated protein
MHRLAEQESGYRRGAVMGLTMAEAFILICFALLLLFAFWQWETDKENTPRVIEFKELPTSEQEALIEAKKDGSLDAFIMLRKQGFDFQSRASLEQPEEKWRFIDKDDIRRLVDAASQLPPDMQRDLADMVEDSESQRILQEMAILEELVRTGSKLADLLEAYRITERVKNAGVELDVLLNVASTLQSGFSIDDIVANSELLQTFEKSGLAPEDIKSVVGLLDAGVSSRDLLSTAEILKTLNESGQSIEELLATIESLQTKLQAGQTLEGIAKKIRQAEAQEAALVGMLRAELGGIVSAVGGEIDDTGAIILPDSILFEQGKAQITPILGKFLADACDPWLTVLQNSGVKIAEVKIEGHASSEWRSGSDARQAYLGNLDLSQRRSQAVLRVCLDLVRDQQVLDWARQHLIAVGYSSVRPILKDGAENPEASRRVVFSVSPSKDTLIDEIETDAITASYDRSAFGTWDDNDGDCRNRRADLLAQFSTGPVTYSKDGCRIERGIWKDPYSGSSFSSAAEVEIDHLVPLKWAWERGAASWTPDQKWAFFNDQANLFIVGAITNKEKSDKGPIDWLPEDGSFRCQYVTRFKRVTLEHKLTIDAEEMQELNELLNKLCN